MYIHLGCGLPALIKLGKPWAVGDIIEAVDVENIDSTHPVSGDPVLCGSCGKWLSMMGDVEPEKKEDFNV